MDKDRGPMPIQGANHEGKPERKQFFDELNEGFARLKADPEAWADWQAELKSMEGTLMDGFEDDPWEE